MSIRISHHKLTREKPNKIYASNRFRYLSKHLSKFKKGDQKLVESYLQMIEWCRPIDRIEYATNESQYQRLKRIYIKESDIIYETNPERLEERIAVYEHQKGLVTAKRYTMLDIPGYWNMITYYDLEYKEGFYATDEGFYSITYHKKAIKSTFLQDLIRNDETFYFMDFEYFDKAYRSINFALTSDVKKNKVLMKQFKDQFIMNYEKGKSFLGIPYNKEDVKPYL